MRRTEAYRYPPPRPSDWFLLIGSLLFVACGVSLLRSEPDIALPTITFFGLCAAVGAATVVRKLRISGGHTRPFLLRPGTTLRPSRIDAVVLGASLAITGVVLWVFREPFGPIFGACAALSVIVGAVILLGTAVGLIPAGYVRLEADGLVMGLRRGSYTIRWDDIAAVEPGELSRNPVMFLWLKEGAVVVAHPPASADRIGKQCASNRRWIGADLMLMTSPYGVDLPGFVAAVQHYARNEAARSDLLIADFEQVF